VEEGLTLASLCFSIPFFYQPTQQLIGTLGLPL
jgi:hypothetical protein